jgi:plasmid replication initiation protein
VQEIRTEEKPSEQLTWLLQPTKESVVRQENRLVEARYNLTTRELKLVMYACAMVDPKAKDFGLCQIRVQDFAKLTGTEPNTLYKELRETAEQIRRKDLILENIPQNDPVTGEVKYRRIATAWFINVVTDANGDGYLAVRLEPQLKPFLLQLKGHYTEFQIGFAVRMKSQYAIRLYQLLQRWAFVGERRIGLDELRLCMGCREIDKHGQIVKDHLAAYNNFKRKALLPAVEEVNAKSDLSAQFFEEKSRASKSVAALRFVVRRNATTANTFQGLPSPLLPKLPDEQQSQVDQLAQEFRLSAKQSEAVRDYVNKSGLDYVHEKAEIVRASTSIRNRTGAFLSALRDDWPQPVGDAAPKPKQKTLVEPQGWREALKELYQNADYSAWRKYADVPESLKQEVEAFLSRKEVAA